ncbi:MAG: tRNA (adenosine(37)-N6)-dimethylallyltransferase MiaA, partial [Candidatus Muproteobacteria bacterium RBG_16_62_13]
MATDHRPLAICLMGPTATGKPALAIALREHLPVDIVSVDASQVYRGLDIGTAKPGAAELARAPHRLIDIRDPSEVYSAAEFCRDALREIDDIHRAGRLPLLVGGTMFYFRALEFGLSRLPAADPAIRARLLAEAERHGWAALHARLEQIDPVSAGRIHPNDPQRLQRALEIFELTGEAPSRLQARDRPVPAPFRFVRLAIIPGDREALQARIARRFQAMLEQGFLAEAEGLYRRGDLHPDLPSMRTVGYRQAWEYLSGRLSYTDMVERAVLATRQLAKRQ